MTIQHILNTAFILGLIVQLTKLSDLIFRQHQKKKIQDWFETLTLRLENSQPAKYFYNIFQKKVIRGFLIFFALIYAVLPIYAISFATSHSNDNLKYENDLLLYLIGFGLSLIILLCTYLGFRLYGLRLLTWQIQGTFTKFAIKYLLIGIPFIMPSIFQRVIIFNSNSPDIWIIFTIFSGILIITGVAGVWWTLSFYGFIVIVFRIIIFLLEIFLKISRMILWRIIEYNKGAVAAITLIVTVLIGLLNLIYKGE